MNMISEVVQMIGNLRYINMADAISSMAIHFSNL